MEVAKTAYSYDLSLLAYFLMDWALTSQNQGPLRFYDPLGFKGQ